MTKQFVRISLLRAHRSCAPSQRCRSVAATVPRQPRRLASMEIWSGRDMAVLREQAQVCLDRLHEAYAGFSLSGNHNGSFDGKRRPGRPWGTIKSNPAVLEPKRPVGRPRGSGPKQLAAAAQASSVAQTKRPVGRPRRDHNLQDEGSERLHMRKVSICIVSLYILFVDRPCRVAHS